jgi:hypothetical protein
MHIKGQNCIKKVILILTSLVCGACYGQIEKIILSKDGFQPSSLTIDADSIPAKLIYERTIVWVKRTYSYPDKVIKTTIENSMVRIEGSQVATYTKSMIGQKFDVVLSYTLEINIKDGKFKLDFYKIETMVSSETSVYTDIHKLIFNKHGTTRNKDGERIRIELENSINGIVTSLSNSIFGKANDW